MGALVVVPTDPACNHAAGVLQGFEPVVVDALVFERSDHTLDHAVLLRAVRGDELLLQTIASDQRRVAAAGEDQSVVRSQQEWMFDFAQAATAPGWLESMAFQLTALSRNGVPSTNVTGSLFRRFDRSEFHENLN